MSHADARQDVSALGCDSCKAEMIHEEGWQGETTGKSTRTLKGEVRIAFAGDGQFPPGSFDSLGAVEMANSLSSILGLKLPQTLVFDYPSVKAMADHIHGLLTPAKAVTALPGSKLAPLGMSQADSIIQACFLLRKACAFYSQNC